jgi:hypothetical protein
VRGEARSLDSAGNSKAGCPFSIVLSWDKGAGIFITLSRLATDAECSREGSLVAPEEMTPFNQIMHKRTDSLGLPTAGTANGWED